MPNTGLNRNKDLTYRIDCYSRKTSEDFEFLATADLKAEQTKSTGKANEFIYYFDQQEPSLQYEYVVTAISPEGVKSKTVSTSESLGLCYVTEPEIIFASNGSLNNLTAEKEGESETYDVVEYTGDSFGINVVKTDSSSDLEVKVNGQTVDADTVLEDGFNTITATASKNRARPITVTKNIYVTKKLVDPTITTNATQNGTTKVNGVTYDKMQYSYLTYDNCTYSIDNSANADSQITFKLDNTATTNLSGTLTDGTHSLEIIVEKEHCRPLTIKKNYSVGIRQIILKLYSADINISHNTKYSGTIKFYVLGGTEKTIRDYKSTGYTRNVYNTYTVPADYYLYFNSKSSTARFDTSGSWAGNDPLRDVQKDFTLSDIKGANGTLHINSEKNKKPDSYSSEDTYHRLYITLFEAAPPALIAFSPESNGITDSNGFEYVEVADSSTKASYTISSQGGASISGKVDSTSFNGNKTGELATGEHTITVTSKQSGFNDLTISKKIKVITPLQDPNLYFYANNTYNRIDSSTSNSPVPSYTTYDLALTANGTGNATLEIAAGTGESVTVEDGGNELTANGNGRYELALGPHNLVITVSKSGYKPKVINKDIYIQGTLSEPDVVKVTSTDIESGSGNSQNDPRVIKYSYLDNDTLQCRVAPGNTGNTVVVHKGTIDGDVIDDATTSFDAGYNTVQTLTIVQTRQHCKTRTTTKYVKGIIKPVTLHFNNHSGTGKLEVWLDGFKNTTFNLKGNINVNNNCMYNYEKSKYEVTQRQWQTLNDSTGYDFAITCYTPSDNIKLTVDRLRRDVGSGADEPKEGFGGSCTRTLSDLRSEGSGRNWVFLSDTISSDKYSIRPKITFTVSD